MLETLAFGVSLFALTNIDDLLVLVAFFADRRMTARAIVSGQFIGIFALVVASAAFARASLLLPLPYVGLLGLLPIALGVSLLVRREQDDDCVAIDKASHRSQALAVAAVTIANGGDNIGVYTPVFAVRTLVEVLATTLLFAIMTAVWCLISHWLVNHRSVGTSFVASGIAYCHTR